MVRTCGQNSRDSKRVLIGDEEEEEKPGRPKKICLEAVITDMRRISATEWRTTTQIRF